MDLSPENPVTSSNLNTFTHKPLPHIDLDSNNGAQLSVQVYKISHSLRTPLLLGIIPIITNDKIILKDHKKVQDNEHYINV